MSNGPARSRAISSPRSISTAASASDCGTPLTYRQPGGLEIAIGAFDDRSDLAPQIQVNYAARLPWVETIFDQPVHDDPDYYAQQEAIISFQHPDHETSDWPSQGLKL